MKFPFVFAVLGIALSAPAIAENTFSVVADEMTDAKRGIAAINTEGNITPVVKCDKNRTGTLYISLIAKKYLGKTISRYGSGARRTAKFRFDGGEPYDLTAYYDGSTANFFEVGTGSPSHRLLRNMMTSERMVIQLTNYNYEPVIDAFDLLNAREVILKAAAACGDTIVE